MTEQQFNSPGFVYTWSEVSTGKIYCGSRKGIPEDGYICSSKTLLPKIKTNPSDYIRKLEYVGTWGLAIGLEQAINKQLIKDLDTTYNRGAGKTIVNEINPFFGKFRESHSTFKGCIVATNKLTGAAIQLSGLKEIREAGFNTGHVYDCVNGKRKYHKGHTFKRLQA